ncbi:serendipity locus protein alpha-like isoform X2 [Periplaneta americana]|uniref:serendipity locus protein alpha-like isoform X2 n=1 Tax=Periplaneta americana TaxID=6978 RepID=UPI0037E79508
MLKVMKLESLQSADLMNSKTDSLITLTRTWNEISNMLVEFESLEYCKEHKEEFKTTIDEFNESFQLLKSSIESGNDVPLTQVQKIGRNLLESLIGLLHKIDNLSIERIQQSLLKCRKALAVLQSAKSVDLLIQFENLVDVMQDCNRLLDVYARDLASQKHKNTILLCRSQINKCLRLMINVYQAEGLNETVTFQESMSYLIPRIQWCFSELYNLTEAPIPKEDEEKEMCDGQFVHRMDLILEMLACVKVEEFNDILPQIKGFIDELLCHAMAIAQVSIENDSENIKLNCHKVLHAYENIKKESASDTLDSGVRQLYSYSLAEALETLERHVNTALLNLVLEVFYDSHAPLKKLIQASCNISVTERYAKDLDELISKFDLHMDRIMQIGMFAMACSGDRKRILGIRSCLASLESLEPELVPAVTAYYIKNDQSLHRKYLKMLSDHWQSEVLELEKLIDGIVDPAAFCQVIQEEVYQMAALLKVSLRRDYMFIKTLSQGIYKKSSKLVKHLRISTREMEPCTSELKIPPIIEDLYYACEECYAASNVPSDGDDFVYHARLMKRCKLVVSLIKKLQPILNELMNRNNSLEEAKDCKAVTINSEQDMFENIDMKLNEIHLNDEADLLPYIEKGRKLHQDRSILYQTPRSEKKHLLKVFPKHSFKRKAQRRLFSRDDSVNEGDDNGHPLAPLENDTLGLEITDILEKLTSLSSTLVTFTGSDDEQCSPNSPNSNSVTCVEVEGV